MDQEYLWRRTWPDIDVEQKKDDLQLVGADKIGAEGFSCFTEEGSVVAESGS